MKHGLKEMDTFLQCINTKKQCIKKVCDFLICVKFEMQCTGYDKRNCQVCSLVSRCWPASWGVWIHCTIWSLVDPVKLCLICRPKIGYFFELECLLLILICIIYSNSALFVKIRTLNTSQSGLQKWKTI